MSDATWALKEVCEHLRSTGALPPTPTPVIVLAKGREPPPRHSMTSCVYICMWDNGYFYCGETDDIKVRPSPFPDYY
jgi:hypothetical protein